METLHTILLGPYKYLLRSFIGRLNTKQREEIQSIVYSFNFSGFKVKLGSKLFRHYKSFVGRDFKCLAQCALFVFRNYFTSNEKIVWFNLTKVSVKSARCA